MVKPSSIWQSGRFVYGLEGDLSWSGLKGEGTCANPAFNCETRLFWLGTLRGRLGVAYNTVLLYATGGLALGEIKTRAYNVASGAHVDLTANIVRLGVNYRW